MTELKKIKRESFELFTSPLITNSPLYGKSNKTLSISYRYEGSDAIFAYFALKEENYNNNQLREQNGCKILGFYFADDLLQVRKDQVYDEMIDRIAATKFSFNYFWFDAREKWAENFLLYLQNSSYSYDIIDNYYCLFLL